MTNSPTVRGSTEIVRAQWKLPTVRRPLTSEEMKNLEPQCDLVVMLRATQIVLTEVSRLRLQELQNTSRSFAAGLAFHEKVRNRER